MGLVTWMCVLAALLGLCEGSPTVTVAQGRLQGLFLRSRGLRQFSAFLGVPYAAPPVKSLRFQKPAPAEPWTGVRNATTPGSPCTQSRFQSKRNVTGREDCLYLNVFTPSVSSESKVPVMVFIHGGGFMEGFGTLYPPDFFMDRDVVLVTFNYRLGVLGFLSMEDKDLPGNYGLKDQVAALRWVKDNIAQFGGDPECITIFGESAGAASVHLLMLSPLSKGLFHRAISQSGSALSPWAVNAPGQSRAMAENFAAELGCYHDSTLEILDCLRAMPAYVLAEVSQTLNIWHMHPLVLFPPTIEPKGVKDAFITQDPWTLSSDIPWVAGVNSEEGLLAHFVFEKEHMAELNDDFELIAPIAMYFHSTAEDTTRTSFAIKKFYFLDGDIKTESMEGLIKMVSDSWFVYPALESFRRHKGRKYFYLFDYRGSNSLLPGYNNGVCHFDEVQFLFPMNQFYENFNASTPEDRKMSEKLIDYWVNFATQGKPSQDGSWPESKNGSEFLHIKNDGSVMDKDLLKERDDFWRSLPYRNKPLPEDRLDATKKDEL